jgi:hypothetical protein
MSWIERVSFPKVVRGLKHNNFRILEASYPKVTVQDLTSHLVMSVEYLPEAEVWTFEINAWRNRIPGFGYIGGPLGMPYILTGWNYPSTVVRNAKQEMMRFRDDRAWDAKWRWKYAKEEN